MKEQTAKINNNLSKDVDDIDEKNFITFVNKLKKVPCFKVRSALGIEENFEISKFLKLSTNFGIKLTLEYKDGEWQTDLQKSSISLECEVKKDSSLRINEHLSIDNSCALKTRLTKREDGLKTDTRSEVVFYLKNNHGKLLKKKCNDVFLMGPPHRMDYCKLVHIRGEIGLDLKAFADVSKFLIENNKSVKSGFAKLAGKSSKDTIKMIGDNLYEYLLNNSG